MKIQTPEAEGTADRFSLCEVHPYRNKSRTSQTARVFALEYSHGIEDGNPGSFPLLEANEAGFPRLPILR